MKRIRKSPSAQYSVQVHLPGRRAPGVEAVCGELQGGRITTERMTSRFLLFSSQPLYGSFHREQPLDEPIPEAHLVQSRPDIQLRVGIGVLRAEFRPG